MTISTPEEPAGIYFAPLALIPDWAFRRLDDKPAEVFKFYAWLQFAVLGDGNRGYKKLAEIAEARGVSERTVKRWIAALVDAGVMRVERFRRRNGQLGQNVYYCPRDEPGGPTCPSSEPARGHRVTPGGEQEERSTRGHRATPGQGSPGDPSINPDTNSFTQREEPLRGSSAAPASLDAAAQPPLIPDEILDAEIVTEERLPAVRDAASPPALNAGRLTAEWVDWCRGRGIVLPNREIKRYAREFKEVIDQGIPEDLIRAALNAMARDRVIARPSLFQTYLVRVQTGPELPPERLTRVDAAAERRAVAVGKTGSQVMQELLSEFDMETGRFRR